MKNFIYQQSANYFNTWAFVYVLRNSFKKESSKKKKKERVQKRSPLKQRGFKRGGSKNKSLNKRV
ncbi:hypothetical protein D2C76_06805 [Helicobacter pylori]|nr:hypothetical protein [Helicobacter pylori]QEF38392.1 hypothetical protein D2C76_06805 [Helicobacter pylori]